MNLHQAKGLEAEVVILADPTGSRPRAPEIHMHRTEDGSAVGYLRVTESREGFAGDQVLALAEGWQEHEGTERRVERGDRAARLIGRAPSSSDAMSAAAPCRGRRGARFRFVRRRSEPR